MRQRAVELTTKERKKLAQTLLGYGRLTEAAYKTGLHTNTLRIINLTGKGEPETIQIIRENLIWVANVNTISQ